MFLQKDIDTSRDDVGFEILELEHLEYMSVDHFLKVKLRHLRDRLNNKVLGSILLIRRPSRNEPHQIQPLPEGIQVTEWNRFEPFEELKHKYQILIITVMAKMSVGIGRHLEVDLVEPIVT